MGRIFKGREGRGISHAVKLRAQFARVRVPDKKVVFRRQRIALVEWNVSTCRDTGQTPDFRPDPACLDGEAD